MKKFILPFALITLLSYSCKKEQALQPITGPVVANQSPTLEQLDYLDDEEVEEITEIQFLSELAVLNTGNEAQQANRSGGKNKKFRKLQPKPRKWKTRKVYVCLTLRNGRVLILRLPARLVPYFVSWGATILDADRDGYTDANACYGSKDDCNDNNDSINPGMIEICGNNIDDNCDGQVDENCSVSVAVLGGAYQGGTVFYIDSTGLHGLIATNADLPAGDWYAVSSGATNLVQNGYSDWYLPNRSELQLMHVNRIHLSGLTSADYWSSTLYNPTSIPNPPNAYTRFFLTGSETHNDRTLIKNARAIRSF